MLKIHRSIFLVALIGIYTGSGCDNDTPASGGSFEAVAFSDVHFDPFYDPSLFPALNAADPNDWAGIFQTSQISAPSISGSDTNFPLLMLALQSLRQNIGDSPVMIFTGDILVHKFHQTFATLYGSDDVQAMEVFADKTVAFVMEQVRASAGNIPVVFAVGNNDSYDDLGPDNVFLSHTAELFYTDFLNGIANHKAFLSTFTRGGYYSVDLPETNLMVVGINSIIFSPFLPTDNSSAVATELTWLNSTLASAKAAGKKVWILMHVPPGGDLYSTSSHMDENGHITTATMMWKPDYQAGFLEILSKYSEIVTMNLAGHTHMDEYRILSPSEALEVTPSISPRSGNDPAFKVITFYSDSLEPADYQSWNCDLAALPSQFNSYYTFSEDYGLDGPLDESLRSLVPALVTDMPQQARYRAYYTSGNNASTLITDTNWRIYFSGIANMEEQAFIDGGNAY